MTFANLPLFAVFGGLAALAGLLFVLQRLRTRHIEVTVPTTLFWLAAVRDAPVRVFWARFRHWLAYLLVLLICALLWLALAGPEAASRHAVDFHVLFLDGSAHTAKSADHDRAVSALKADLESLPADRREVIWGGAFNLKLLRAGEDALLLDQRLELLTPDASPSALNDQLRLLSIPGVWPERLELVIYGRAPVDAESLDDLPGGIRVTKGVEYPPAPSGVGIVAFGVAPALSGDAQRVDALITVRAPTPAAIDVTVRLDGAPLAEERVKHVKTEDGRTYFIVRDLPAIGGILAAEVLDTRGSELDNMVRLRLPTRRVLPVAVASDVPALITDVINADAGMALSSLAAAAVVVRRAGSDFGDNLPALELVPAATQTESFVIGFVDESSHDAEHVLRAGTAALGLDQIDATGLASALQRPVAIAVEPAAHRHVAVWEELFGAKYNFADERGFPLFVARALRYLAANPVWHAYMAAGRPLPIAVDGAPWLDRPEPTVDLLGAQFSPVRAGEILGPDAPWIASLLSDDLTSGRPGMKLPAYTALGGGAEHDIAMWLSLLALALLAGEWVLQQRGLIP